MERNNSQYWDDDSAFAEMNIFQIVCLGALVVLAEHWRTVVGALAVVGSIIWQYYAFHHELGLFLAFCGTIIITCFTLISVAATLENENCKAATAYGLWKRCKLLRMHISLALSVTVLTILGCALINQVTNISINRFAVLSMMVSYPLLIIVVGFLSTGSRAEFVSPSQLTASGIV